MRNLTRLGGITVSAAFLSIAVQSAASAQDFADVGPATPAHMQAAAPPPMRQAAPPPMRQAAPPVTRRRDGGLDTTINPLDPFGLRRRVPVSPSSRYGQEPREAVEDQEPREAVGDMDNFDPFRWGWRGALLHDWEEYRRDIELGMDFMDMIGVWPHHGWEEPTDNGR
ncbi:hypothetical protein GCM10009530_63510 [Microbispora corallina]|uniref:Secreted protein n=1 Tax=Microbispora corallina TaxID=83302 RepID=A0ABQ4GBG2_9ACTN|nr:hypothetical protein Mco01_74190 [Microbispora corallina]